jgi:hypothetical protein
MSATVAIAKGHHCDHRWAVQLTQEKRRCCLLNTECGLTDDDVLWVTLSAWTNFQPRKALPRKDPGHLFCPNDVSDVFEKYWNHLTCLDRHPDFAAESEITQFCMTLFSEGLAKMDAHFLVLHPSAEAHDKDVLVAEHAAASRLRPIQNGLDCWEEHRSSADTGLGGPAPDGARTMF